MSKYIIDTQLVIRAIRHHDEAEKMDDFLSAFSSSVYLSSVVVQELLAGARDAEMRRLVAAIQRAFPLVSFTRPWPTMA